jgi:outer membrane protein
MLIFSAGGAAAEDIAGKFGITGKIGFMIPADSELATGGRIDTIGTDLDFIGGGGFIYGIDNRLAAEFDITHTSFNGSVNGHQIGDFEVINLALGGQYRFDSTVPHLTPYLGAGLDLLVNDLTDAKVDNTFGLHVAAGLDYFVNSRVALTTEVKGVVAFESDIMNRAGTKIGKFDPSSVSMTFGVRLFLN